MVGSTHVMKITKDGGKLADHFPAAANLLAWHYYTTRMSAFTHPPLLDQVQSHSTETAVLKRMSPALAVPQRIDRQGPQPPAEVAQLLWNIEMHVRQMLTITRLLMRRASQS